MNERNKLIMAVVAVMMIVAVVVGSTYAFWQWSTNSSQSTTVNFTVPTGDQQLSASISGGTISVSRLAPTACTTAKHAYAMSQPLTVTYKNQTTQTASLKATLAVSGWTQPHTGTVDLSKLHFTLSKGSSAGSNCTSGTIVKGGSSSSFVSTGNLINNEEILSVPANTAETSETWYLWVWIDSSYSGGNSGSAVTDPMQDLSFTLTWSGTISNQN